MADFEITQDNTADILAALPPIAEKAMTIIGMKAEKYAKARCPVGTPESTGWTDKNGKRHPNKGYRGGTLRNSITFDVQIDGTSAELAVGTNVEYAPYVELGTGPKFKSPPEWESFTAKKGGGQKNGMAPRPYLRPAIEDHINEYKNIIETEMKNA